MFSPPMKTEVKNFLPKMVPRNLRERTLTVNNSEARPERELSFVFRLKDVSEERLFPMMRKSTLSPFVQVSGSLQKMFPVLDTVSLGEKTRIYSLPWTNLFGIIYSFQFFVC